MYIQFNGIKARQKLNIHNAKPSGSLSAVYSAKPLPPHPQVHTAPLIGLALHGKSLAKTLAPLVIFSKMPLQCFAVPGPSDEDDRLVHHTNIIVPSKKLFPTVSHHASLPLDWTPLICIK